MITWLACLSAVSGCNRTDGSCYYTNDGGSSGAGAGVGGSFGVSVGVGAGGKGDYASPGPQSAEDEDEPICNKSDLPAAGGDEDKPTIKQREVFCTKADHGIPCSDKCLAKGIPCGPIAAHARKGKAGGLGQLYACNTVAFGDLCSYAYPNGDVCHFYFGFPIPNWCAYAGKD